MSDRAVLPPHLRAGRAAEAAACRFLQSRGLRVVARNVRVAPGEIDIVARDGPVWVFVEVRWRASAAFGGALASITAAKRARLQRAASAYLLRFALLPCCRLDALCLDGPLPPDEHTPAAWVWVRGL